jgi:cytochrome P450
VDELQVIDHLRARYGPVFRRRPGVLYVTDPAEAKAVLANTGLRYREHSDFFFTSKGIFGPREAQQEVGRAARNLLRDHWARRATDVDLGAVSHWPDAGNLLLHRCFQDALVGHGELRQLVDQVVRHAVLAGARDRRSPLSRAVLRTRVRRALVAELARRQPRGEPEDLLDVLVATGPADSTHRALVQLSEVFLSCVFAVAGSMGFLLGWSVYLLGTEPDSDADPGAVVREALRLWPVAWNFGRSPVRPHQLGDVPVTVDDEVVVCSYLVHRDRRYWNEPDTFCPQRWAGAGLQAEAFIPFGWGSHTCVAAGFAVQVVEDILRTLPPASRWHVEPHQHRPQVAAALAPPKFTLRLGGR